MILSPNGGRLSKRDGAVSVRDYIKEGYLSEAMLNYLVRLGWSHGDQELFSREELCRLFSLEQVGKKGAVFDLKKLAWLNAEYLKKMAPAELLFYAQSMLAELYATFVQQWPNSTKQTLLCELFKTRVSTVAELLRAAIDLAKRPAVNLTELTGVLSPQTGQLLHEFLAHFAALSNALELLAWSKELCQKHAVKLPALAQPLRLAITGHLHSPNIFGIITLLEAPEVEVRIQAMLAGLG
jgi:glutamyl-tRNA synthetase